jgi:transcription antitermination factor NusA-like protein
VNETIGYIVSFLGGGGLVAFLVIWGLKNLDKVEVLAAWFYRTFSWAYGKWVYSKAATEIQAAMNGVGEAINKESEDALPHAMKVEWAKTAQDAEAFLRNGEIIITMAPSPNRDRNLVVSTLVYLGKGLLPRSRPYVDKTLMRATDFTVAKRVFMSAGQSMAMPFFFENYLEPAMQKEPELRHYCMVLDELEKAGFFTRILLKQLCYLGDKVFPATPDEATLKETRDFAAFLTDIASKKRGEPVLGGLAFVRSRIRASVMLVAREETKKWGTEAYDRRTKIHMNSGVENMYILARGAENISLAEQVASEQEKAGRLRILARRQFVQTIDDEQLNAICILCSLNLMTPSRAVSEPTSAVYQVVEEYVEELRAGRLEVVALARHPGIMSKIAVRALADDVDAIGCCSSPERLKAMEAILGDERLEFIEWRDDPRSMIVASLTPLATDDVVDVGIDYEGRQAIVKVNGWKAKRKALGRGEQNVTCAMELTGWQITVEEAPEEPRNESA